MISKTDLLNYVRCPKAYELSKQEPQIEEPVELQIGANFHVTVSEFFKKIDVEECKDMTYNELVEHFMNLLKPAFTPTTKYLTKFALNEAKRFTSLRATNSLALFKPYMTEQEFVCHDLELVGIVDRIDQLIDGTLKIYEYKAKVSNWSNIRLELAFYYLLCVCALKQKVFQTAVYEYLKGEETLVRIDMKTFEFLKQKIESLRKAQKKHWFPRKVSDNCLTCLFLEVCKPFEAQNAYQS